MFKDVLKILLAGVGAALASKVIERLDKLIFEKEKSDDSERTNRDSAKESGCTCGDVEGRGGE